MGPAEHTILVADVMRAIRFNWAAIGLLLDVALSWLPLGENLGVILGLNQEEDIQGLWQIKLYPGLL